MRQALPAVNNEGIQILCCLDWLVLASQEIIPSTRKCRAICIVLARRVHSSCGAPCLSNRRIYCIAGSLSNTRQGIKEAGLTKALFSRRFKRLDSSLTFLGKIPMRPTRGGSARDGLAFATLRPPRVLQRVCRSIKAPSNKSPVSRQCSFCANPSF